MKKQLLLSLSVGICLTANAQSQMHAVKQNTSNKTNKIEKTSPSFFSAATKKNNKLKGPQSSSTSKQMISSSWNAFGILVSESNNVTADQSSNTINFTHRISQDWAPTGVNSGYVQNTFSTDGGVTWDSLLIVGDQSQAHLCRYPSGAVFNPNGTTNPDSVFTVVSGPWHPGANWAGDYFGSIQHDGTNNDVLFEDNTAAPFQDFVRIGMQSAGNKVVVTGGLYLDANGATAAAQGYMGATVNYGTFNTIQNNFNWTVDSIIPNFYADPTDGSNSTYTEAQHAWSKDGSIGYVVFLGIDANATCENQAYQPLVWKTTNGGTTWLQMPLTDFSAIPSINANLTTCTDGITKKAWFSASSGWDAVLDANDNLHIVSIIKSGSSTALDSLGYTWDRADGISYIYDTYTSATGWNAILLDSLKSITADASSPFFDTNGSITVDARIQASKTEDGKQLFYFWMDSDPTSVGGENAVPDIFGKGLNTTNNKLTATIQFTTDHANYYLYASSTALESGSNFSIPATVSDSRGGTGDTESTFNHFYVSGISFTNTDFIVPVPASTEVAFGTAPSCGINGIDENQNSFSVSQNYPNPFNKSTAINISLKTSENVSVEIFNTVGQKVYTTASEKLGIGTHTFNIDGTKLTSGVYFYTVRVGNNKVTNRMIVQ